MTDAEIIKRCAEKMVDAGEYRAFHAPVDDDPWVEFSDGTGGDYDPFNDGHQALALVKGLRLVLSWQPNLEMWWVHITNGKPEVYAADLNRAICECVAKLPRD